MTKYNTTQLDVDKDFENLMFHRDRFAHYFRWTHVSKCIRTRKHNILDIGCGSGNMLKVLFTNRIMPKQYVGLDFKKSMVNKMNKEWSHKQDKYDISFKQCDIVKNRLSNIAGITNWDFITCFEVLEHIGKKNINKALKNIATQMSDKTKLFISTPVYDPKVGAASNHIVDGVIGEFKFNELKKHLEKHFTIESVHGTFASQKDVKPVLTNAELTVYNSMKEFYDVDMLSIMFAPMHPEQSRNCFWILTK